MGARTSKVVVLFLDKSKQLGSSLSIVTPDVTNGEWHLFTHLSEGENIMGWDYDTSTHTCPCGNSTYTVTHGSNDWGQSSSSYSMQCPECKENYVDGWNQYEIARKRSDGHYWMKKGDYERQQLERKEAQARAEAAHREYLRQWCSTKHRVSRQDFENRIQFYEKDSPEWSAAWRGLEQYNRTLEQRKRTRRR